MADILIEREYDISVSLLERQSAITQEFQSLTHWEDRYKKLIEIGKALPDLPDEKKLEKMQTFIPLLIISSIKKAKSPSPVNNKTSVSVVEFFKISIVISTSQLHFQEYPISTL